MTTDLLQHLKDSIAKHAFVTEDEQYIHGSGGAPQRWLFDFRKIILQPAILDAYATLFIETHKHKLPFQVAGLEVAAIPLVTAIVMKSASTSSPINGFFIRKSRKKSGLLNMVEGTVLDEKVILVDDILNSGGTFLRQMHVIDDLRDTLKYTNLRVEGLSAILQFKPTTQYLHIIKKKIAIHSFFDLDALNEVLPVQNITSIEKQVPVNHYEPLWRWRGKTPRLEYVLPKAAPLFSHKTLFTIDDSGHVTALDPSAGTCLWEYGLRSINTRRTAAFSNPIPSRHAIFFGSPDGNIYSVHPQTGRRQWVFLDADWVSADLDISKDEKFLFAVCDYGTFTKKSNVVALDTETGKTVWRFTPTLREKITTLRYIDSVGVIVGTSNGIVRVLSAKTGTPLWETKLPLSMIARPGYISTRNELIVTGLPEHNTEHDYGSLTVLNARTGGILRSFSNFSYGSYSEPIVYTHLIIFSSLDKHIYAVDSTTMRVVWSVYTGARIFAPPTLCTMRDTDRILIGSNNGVMYEINPDTGAITSQTYVTERITSRIAYDAHSDTVFLPTYANEIYALKRKDPTPEEAS